MVVVSSMMMTSCTTSASPSGTSAPAGGSAAPASGNAQLPSSSGVSGLIQAQYPDCGQQGDSLASYLSTGQPTSDDPTYGDKRQMVLSLAGEQRALYIRQEADALIQACDGQETQALQQQQAQQQAAQQQAAQQAAAAAQQAAQAAAIAKAQPACQAVNGQVGSDGGSLVCRLRYIGTDGSTYSGEATVKATSGQFDGPMNTAGIGATQQECTSRYYPQLPSGPGYGPPGTWNPALQVCIPSS